MTSPRCEDEGVAIVSRYDAFECTIKAGVRWVWKGPGKPPQPEIKPESLLIDDHWQVKLFFHPKAWGAARVLWIAPCCGQRRRILYEVKIGSKPELRCRVCAKQKRSSRHRWQLALARGRRKMRSGNSNTRRDGRTLIRKAEKELLLGDDTWFRRQVHKRFGADRSPDPLPVRAQKRSFVHEL